MDILVDTGILLRLTDPIHALHGTATRAVQTLLGRGDRLVIAAQNAAEFWNVCTRPATARGGLGLTVAESERRLGVVESNFSRLTEPAAAYAIWRHLVTTHAVIGRQVHDARLVALMIAHGITHVLTLNPGDFARFPGIVEFDPANP